MLAKVIACLFLTGITDWIVSKFLDLNTEAQYIPLAEQRQFYFWVGTIKLLALIVIMLLSTYAKIYREDMTENFTKKPVTYDEGHYHRQAQRQGVQE